MNTHIEIYAPADKVWQILTDFESYPKWNPFIKSINGQLEEGSRLEVVLHLVDEKPMKFKPKCYKLEINKKFSWKGNFILPGIFDGLHSFKIESISADKTKFIQEEKFTGILVPFFWGKIQNKTRASFELMNSKLKELAEA